MCPQNSTSCLSTKKVSTNIQTYLDDQNNVFISTEDDNNRPNSPSNSLFDNTRSVNNQIDEDNKVDKNNNANRIEEMDLIDSTTRSNENECFNDYFQSEPIGLQVGISIHNLYKV